MIAFGDGVIFLVSFVDDETLRLSYCLHVKAACDVIFLGVLDDVLEDRSSVLCYYIHFECSCMFDPFVFDVVEVVSHCNC